MQAVSGGGYVYTNQSQTYDLEGRLQDQQELSPYAYLRQFVYLNGEPLAMISGSGVIAWYHNDHLGTPQAITNASQQVVWQASYDAFGEATVTIAAVENPLRFPGQVADRHVPGLHYNWHRFYDATTGRYISSDPIGLRGGRNIYAYARSNPLRFMDPRGLDVAEVQQGFVEVTPTATDLHGNAVGDAAEDTGPSGYSPSGSEGTMRYDTATLTIPCMCADGSADAFVRDYNDWRINPGDAESAKEAAYRDLEDFKDPRYGGDGSRAGADAMEAYGVCPN